MRIPYLMGILFGVSLAIAILAAAKISTDRGSQKAILTTIASTRHQVAKSVYHHSPFSFSFKQRGTTMIAFSPFAQDFEVIGRLNSQGFRTPEYTIAHPPNTFRIVVIGDSLTWGPSVQLEETFPYALNKLLNLECTRFRTEVIALGVFGHRLADKLIELLVHGQTLKPDLLIVQISPYDLDFYNYRAIFHSQKISDEINAYRKKEYEVLEENSLDWQVFSECVEQISDWSKKQSVPVAFLAFPLIDSQRNGRNFQHYNLASFPAFPQLTEYGKILNHIADYGFSILNLTDTFRERAQDRYLAISDNNGFPNSYAHRLVAEALTGFLIQQKRFECSRFQVRSSDPQWEQENAMRTQAADQWVDFNTNYGKQLLFYEKLKELYPRDPWITRQLADVYLNLRLWQRAFRTYESLTDLAPGLAAPWYHMATAGGGLVGRAKLLERMLEVVPDHSEAMQALAMLYLKDNRVADACRLISRLTQIASYTDQYEVSKELFSKNECGRVLEENAEEISGPKENR